MATLWTRRMIIALGGLLVTPPPLSAAFPKDNEAPAASSLAGQLLIAAPDIGDPRFAQAVILMAVHSPHGALGITLNRPVGTKPLASLLRAVGQDATGVSGDVRIFIGGPVEPQAGFVVHTAEYRRAGTIAIDAALALTSNPEVLRDIGHKRGPKQSLIAFGYAGWAPGQLEFELARHAWFTTPETPHLVFDVDRDALWDEALARRAVPL